MERKKKFNESNLAQYFGDMTIEKHHKGTAKRILERLGIQTSS